jgi:hypothetical protein
MDLHGAAIFFDTDPITDGYTGSPLFDAQASSFDDSSSDGATSRRRILSTGPDIVIPTRRCVVLDGAQWLVGLGTVDSFGGSPIRQHFTMKRVTDLVALLTPAQAVAAATGTPAYCQKMYFKDTSNALTDSEYDAQWNIFVAPGEVVGKGYFLRDRLGILYRVRNDYLPTEGLRILQSDQLDIEAVQSCVFDTGTFNPVTEARTAGTTTVTGIQVDMPKFYRFRHVSDETIQPGDVALYLPASLALKQGMTFTMAGVKCRVMAFQAEMDAQVAHVRRA